MSDSAALDEKDLSGLIFREGRVEDDAQIRALIKNISMPGRVSLTMDVDPSFFNAVEIEGYERHTIVVELSRRIVALGVVSKRTVFINGSPADIGYLSNLRVEKSARGRKIVTEFNRFVNQWLKKEYGVLFYLCAILKGNLKARQALNGGRIDGAEITEIGELYNAAIPLLKRQRPKPPAGIQVMRGGEIGAGAITQFLNREGSQKQFFPVYTAEDIEANGGILRGLRPDDFHIAVKGDRILGVIARWNQLPFRRMMVTGYSGYMRVLQPLLNAVAKRFCLAPVPDPGGSFRNIYAACMALEDNRADVFDFLLDTILHSEYNTGKTFLSVSLMRGDPLLPVVKKHLHFPISTCIYAMAINNYQNVKRLDGRTPYIEAAGL